MEKNQLIERIRGFNRFYTKILGLLENKILKSEYSLLEARILFELFYQSSLSASDLVKQLNVDPAYLSRIIKKFRKKHFIARSPSPEDSRKQILFLTDKGREELKILQDISNNHIESLLSGSTEREQQKLIKAMEQIKSVFSETSKSESGLVTIRNHRMGDIGYLIYQHAVFYNREYGFDISFESYVAETMIKFINSYDEKKERLWIVEKDDTIMGSIAIVHVDNETAQLRWFLLDPEVRGKGIGKKLVSTAVDFCREKKYKKVFLMTSRDLKAARALYSRYGFQIKETKEYEIWGQMLGEEIWELDLIRQN